MASQHEQWSEFLSAWPPERVRQMTLEEYTNPSKDDAFIYWVESRLEKLGSIWGGSAFKFGIYCRDKTGAKEASGGRVWGEKYAWLSKFGATEQEVFATIRGRLVEVLDAVREGNIARIDEVDLAPMLKWKVAFLYQDRARPVLFPIFKKEILFFHYRTIDPRARLGSTPYHVMYETLLERHRDVGEVLEIGRLLWEAYDAERKRTPQAWAVPLAWTIQDPEVIESLCKKTKVEPEDVDSFLDNLLTAADMSEGDQIAMLVEGEVRALGTLTNVEPGQFAWEQVPVNFPSGMLVNPTSEIRELDASERQEIWSHLPVSDAGSEVADQFWKISAETDGSLWPLWRDEGYVSIGWTKLGDLGKMNWEEFSKRRDQLSAEDPKGHSTTKLNQVWRFRNIPPGARVVANQGVTRVFGFGTVTGPYYFVAGDEYPHRLPVRWDDVVERKVNCPSWLRTLLPIGSQSEFEALRGGKSASETSSTEPDTTPTKSTQVLSPCDPRNVILYGPPGTGKTYSTVRRALELILGPEKLVGLGDKGLMALFREHQARGQIEFVTFHQAYGYEEFVEGIRPVLNQAADAQVRYEIHDGVFKRIALRAAAEGIRVEGTLPEFDELWELFIRDLNNEGTRVVKGQSGKNYQLALSSQGSVWSRPCVVDGENNVLSVDEGHQTASKENAALYWKFRAELGPEPEKLTYEKTTALFAREKGGSGGNHYTALWIVYTQLLGLSRSAGTRKSELIDRVARVQQALDKPGPSTTFSFSAQSPQYVLIIDEINRGNMSKILGELITLLEPDKRLAARNELKLPLSYTPQHRFAVPPNLHVLGTMNTADRSIALMDVALRRRFTFEELMPDAEVIRTILRGLIPHKPFIELVAEVFEALNDRIRFLYDRDHQLGHSYFLEISDAGSLRQVFLDRIVPMLQEYFYGAWDKICIVLGCPYDESGAPKRSDVHLLDSAATVKSYANPIITARTFPEVKTLGFDHDDYEDRVDHHVRGAFRQGSLSQDDLYRTFLGVLALDGPTFALRLTELRGEDEVAPTPAEGFP